MERAIKITFDEFLKPVVEAWKSGLPYQSIVFAEEYSSDSEAEVDFAHEELDNNSEEEYDIMKVNGYPSSLYLLEPMYLSLCIYFEPLYSTFVYE